MQPSRGPRPPGLRSWFAAPVAPERQPQFEREIAETNRGRMLALMPLVAIGHVIHIAVFYEPAARRAQLSPQVLQWHDGIAVTHLVTMLPSLVLGAWLFARRRKPAPAWLGAAVASWYLLHGAVVAGIDQLAVTAITPFMGYCLGMAVILVLPLRASLLAYGVGLASFVTAITAMQPDAAKRLAIMPNGISITAVSVVLSFVLYSARRRDFVQRVTIEEQRQALAQLNAGLERRVADQVSEIVARAQEVERLNAQLQAQVRERSMELARALEKLAQQRDDEGKLKRGVVLGGRFEIEGVLGEGGMGVVYQALDQSSGARVAIKVVHAGSSQLDAVHRFLREARVVATITHPGIVRMLHVDVSDDGTLFQAQELVAGDALELRLRRGARWDPHVVARLSATLLDALAAAHALGIVHRDVKPSNMMITLGEPGLKLLDFGISKLYEDGLADDGYTRTGTILGTPAYMAPEQVIGAEQTSDRVDVYAAGVILFQMLTGKYPFEESSTPRVLAHNHVAVPAPDVRSLEPEVPEALADLVALCLSKDPDARPSAAEMALRLGAFADANATPALPQLERSGLVYDLERARAVSAPTLAGPSYRPPAR
jgi:serine/threonine-protein kinase